MKCVITLLFAMLALPFGTSQARYPIPAGPDLPAPTLVRTDTFLNGQREFILEHSTAPAFDSPGLQRRSYRFKVAVPPSYQPGREYPMILYLHGGGGDYNSTLILPALSDWYGTHDLNVIFIIPGDPDATFWTGYSSALPDGFPSTGVIERYTERRLFATMRYAVEDFLVDGRPLQADLNAIFVAGISMGGFGSAALALHYPEVFVGAFPNVPPVGNLEQAQSRTRNRWNGMWGLEASGAAMDNGTPIWDYIDLLGYLERFPASREAFLQIYIARDDDLVNYEMAVVPNAQGDTWLGALQEREVGHYVQWDEGGHLYPFEADPLLGPNWWDNDWSPVNDPETFLRRHLPFPAFSSFSRDGDPGTGTGGIGDWSIPNDNTYDGDRAGCLNRWLRWRTLSIVDTPERFSVELKMLSGQGNDANPHTDATVNVTPRRRRGFLPSPGETVYWRSDSGQQGVALVGDDGAFTLVGVGLTTEWSTVTVQAIPFEANTWLAGWMDTDVNSAGGGEAVLYAYTPDALADAVILVGGGSTGIKLSPLGFGGFEWRQGSAGPITPQQLLLEVAGCEGCPAWPYLHVGM